MTTGPSATKDRARTAPQREAEIERVVPEEFRERVTPRVEIEVSETVAPAEPVANVDAQTPDVAPTETESSKKAGRTKKAPKAPKVAKPAKSESGPR